MDAEQAGPARGQPYVAGHDAIALPLVVVGRDLLRDEGPHHVTERVVLIGENLSPHAENLPRHGNPAPAHIVKDLLRKYSFTYGAGEGRDAGRRTDRGH